MHISTLKLVYIHNELLHASARCVVIFREVKYKGLAILSIKWNYKVPEPINRCNYNHNNLEFKNT